MDSVADRASYLLDAVISGHYRQVKFYLDAGYDQDYVDIHREGSTPLILAVTQVKDDESIRNRLIVLLLQAGADPNIGDRYGMTPLMHSILRRQKSTVRILLESKRLDHGMEDFDGNSALMHAASLGLTDIVTIILERLSAVHRMIYLGQKNRKGLTAGNLAEGFEKKELADLLSWKSTYFLPDNFEGFADPRQLEQGKKSSTSCRETRHKPIAGIQSRSFTPEIQRRHWRKNDSNCTDQNDVQ
ncbi:ankyrin repeat domain-containing protein 34A-like [Daphnia pulex]|uniref:ankyrin repeat domain-containing protein 34A-like n=1 Tax=Daphnia pulex TaxID=6669 RepID=UPI001EE074F6|nr:ankyrin repeat domain-containing protein 34A-like [Daphnia pulex]